VLDFQTRAALEHALRHATEYLGALDEAPVFARTTLEELRERLGRELRNAPTDAARVIDELVADARGGVHGNAGGRFFGWVIGGSLPAALGADWLTSTWDQNAGLFACGPAAAVVEEVAGEWLKDVLGLPGDASFALVTGCQMAHVTCLAAARHEVLDRAGWDVERRGLAGAPAIRILSSTERHGTIARAIRLLGMGTECVVELGVDHEGRLLTEALRAELSREPGRPTIVLLQAGDVNIGAFDDFLTLIPLAHDANAWVHVDGAFGLWAHASPRHRHFTAGADRADSWATDGHKWLNVPYDCGYAFVAHPRAHREAMSYRASYLTHAEEARDQMDWTPEFSRRGRGFSTYAALRELGRDGLADLVGRCCRHAHALTTGIGSLAGAELIWEPGINQGLVRFPDPRPASSGADDDRHTDGVIAAVLRSGEAFFTGTTWRGRRCMRVSVSGWRTSERDVERAIQAVRAALAGA
jgi:glutamate/tyrosine decarboxylase-like PLP-dependent enzyme